MLFDTHAHYYDPRFDADRDEVLSSLEKGGVGYILNAGCDVKTSDQCVEIAKKSPHFYASAGIHPEMPIRRPMRILSIYARFAKTTRCAPLVK